MAPRAASAAAPVSAPASALVSALRPIMLPRMPHLLIPPPCLPRPPQEEMQHVCQFKLRHRVARRQVRRSAKRSRCRGCLCPRQCRACTDAVSAGFDATNRSERTHVNEQCNTRLLRLGRRFGRARCSGSEIHALPARLAPPFGPFAPPVIEEPVVHRVTHVCRIVLASMP